MNPYVAMSNMELLEAYHRKLKAYQPRQGQLQDIELMEKEILKRMEVTKHGN